MWLWTWSNYNTSITGLQPTDSLDNTTQWQLRSCSKPLSIWQNQGGKTNSTARACRCSPRPRLAEKAIIHQQMILTLTASDPTGFPEELASIWIIKPIYSSLTDDRLLPLLSHLINHLCVRPLYNPPTPNSWWHHLKCKALPSLSLGLALASLHLSYFGSLSAQLLPSFCVLAIHQVLTNFCPTIWHLGDGWCQRLPLPVPPPVSMLANASLFFSS